MGAKHLQVVSGVGPGMFWAATLVWDYLNYLIPSFAMLIVFAAYGTNAYVDGHRLGLVLLVLLLYGWAALTFVYLVSFLFRSPATAMVILIIFNIVTGQFGHCSYLQHCHRSVLLPWSLSLFSNPSQVSFNVASNQIVLSIIIVILIIFNIVTGQF